MTLQVHLFSDSGPLSATYDSVQTMANAFLLEGAITSEELVYCQLAITAGNRVSEVALLLVVDVEEMEPLDYPDTPPGALGNINRHDEEHPEEGI